MTNRIRAVGHSTRDFDGLVTMLRNNGITRPVDVRSFPSSRKFPRWNRPAVEEALPPDAEYRWIPRPGGRRHGDVPSPDGAWRVRAFRDNADHTATHEVRDGLAGVLEQIGRAHV